MTPPQHGECDGDNLLSVAGSGADTWTEVVRPPVRGQRRAVTGVRCGLASRDKEASLAMIVDRSA